MKIILAIIFFEVLIFTQVSDTTNKKEVLIERTKTGEVKSKKPLDTNQRKIRNKIDKSATSISGNFPSEKTFLVSTLSAPIRKQAKTSSPIFGRFKLGEKVSLLEKKPNWSKVKSSSSEKVGWLPTEDLIELKRDSSEKIYLQIASRNYGQEMSFAKALELANFITESMTNVKTPETKAEMEFLFLLSLRKAAANYKQSSSPDEFPKKYTPFLVYDEISNRWLVSSESFWNLSEKYKELPIAERIAWEAAQNPLPGECEGFIVCYLYRLRVTKAEYLRLYPNGEKAKQALQDIENSLGLMISDKYIFQKPSDVTDKADFFKLIAELRTIVSRLVFIEKERVLRQLKLLADSL
ncbi:MAG: SH3 domain-containing protein [Pyrinomonadaceae bacterium]|nr:SH3 domain-containing protein [Pyrinomonadaceae bacterium]MCX7638968.1 SH3 domain-containing protein [Pyrinomonadaceae bacterium]MDW8303813.1 SH3 domain-containing protein [Acidobacteriota bacterium]